MKTIAAALGLVALAAPAAAQGTDSRWEAWAGCWELWTDAVREGATGTARLADGPNATQPRADMPRVCVAPASGGGARFETTIRGQAALDQTIVPDGAERPIQDADCRGTQRAEWSRDGLRLLTHAEVTCRSDTDPRRVSGLAMLAANGDWLDIQAVEIGGRETVRVRRYQRAAGQPRAPRALLAASILTVDDVKEASGKLPARAIEAALVESGAGFDLTARTVIELDDAGVADSVIDLMVALSYPERFVVERTARGSGGPGAPLMTDPFMLGWAFGYPVWYDDFYYSPYYYSPFAYSRFGYRPYDVFYGGGIAVVPVSDEPQPSGAGRVVDGQGYTRVRPRETTPEEGGARTRTAAGFADAGSSASGSSSGTASAGGGYSSGGGGDSGRTAVPR